MSEQASDFLSGTSGQVSGIRLTSRALLTDSLHDAEALLRMRGLRLRRAAASLPPRRVLVLAIERRDAPNLLAEARTELVRSRHAVEFVSTEAGTAGKFENLNAMLEAHPATGHDWLLVLDDDVSLPRHFLDNFLFLAERFDLQLAQPAHRARSHAAYQVTRRRPGSVVRETRFVEIGPVSALQSEHLSRPCCRSRRCARGGDWMLTGPRSPASEAGGSGSSTPLRSATACG